MTPEWALLVRAVLLGCLVLVLEQLGKRRAAKQQNPSAKTYTISHHAPLREKEA